MSLRLREADLVGQAEVTPEQAAANKAAGKGPRRARPAKPGRLPISSATLWRWVKAGEFPPPVRLSGGVTAWKLAEIEAWEARQEANDLPPRARRFVRREPHVGAAA